MPKEVLGAQYLGPGTVGTYLFLVGTAWCQCLCAECLSQEPQLPSILV